MKAAEKVSAERGGRNRGRHGVMGEFSDARRLTSAGFVGAPEFYPGAARQWGAAADSGGSRRPRAGSRSVDCQ
jgi:hypothetical protein